MEDVRTKAELAEELERTQRRLRELEAQGDGFYKAILDSLPVQVAVFDRDLRYLYVNPASIADPQLRSWILGKSDAEYCRMRGWSQDIAQGRDHGRRRAVEEGKPTHLEEVLTTPAGEKRSFLRVHSPVVETDGGISKLIGYGVDITEHKELQERLRQAQKLEAIGKLAGGIAHDFNNLLTAVTGYTELLLGDLVITHPLRKHVVEIKKASEHAATLTRQLLAFSRKQVLRTEVFDVNSVVEEMVRLLDRMIGEDVELDVELAPSPPNVRADPSQLRQVILNLVVNARDAMPQGGRLGLRTEPVTIARGAAEEAEDGPRPGSYLLLEVSDTGCGMDPETRDRIFEPFFTTKERGRGTGLGLATVYGIVRQSGGTIRVDSDPGRGTRFQIYLPSTDVPTTLIPPSRQDPADPPKGSELVLVVEDEPAVRRMAQTSLTRMGYEVLVASGAEEALLLAAERTGPIDLLLTDLVMPRMKGAELAERLRRQRPGMKVLFMSGYAQDAVAMDAAFLAKPFKLRALAKRVREVLDDRTTTQGSVRGSISSS